MSNTFTILPLPPRDTLLKFLKTVPVFRYLDEAAWDFALETIELREISNEAEIFDRGTNINHIYFCWTKQTAAQVTHPFVSSHTESRIEYPIREFKTYFGELEALLSPATVVSRMVCVTPSPEPGQFLLVEADKIQLNDDFLEHLRVAEGVRHGAKYAVSRAAQLAACLLAQARFEQVNQTDTAAPVTFVPDRAALVRLLDRQEGVAPDGSTEEGAPKRTRLSGAETYRRYLHHMQDLGVLTLQQSVGSIGRALEVTISPDAFPLLQEIRAGRRTLSLSPVARGGAIARANVANPERSLLTQLRPPPMPAGGEPSHTQKIVLITPRMNSPYWGQVADDMTAWAKRQTPAWQVEMRSANDNESEQEELCRAAASLGTDAVVVGSVAMHKPKDADDGHFRRGYAAVKARCLPVVFLDRYASDELESGYPYCLVQLDNHAAGHAMARYLIEQRGVSLPILVTEPVTTISAAQERSKAFVETVLELNPDWTAERYESEYRIAPGLLGRELGRYAGNIFTQRVREGRWDAKNLGIMTINEMILLEALHEMMADEHLRLLCDEGRIAFATVDNFHLTRYLPKIGVYAHNPNLQAQRAVEFAVQQARTPFESRTTLKFLNTSVLSETISVRLPPS